MSHKFHGRGSGRKKTEKRMKKLRDEHVSTGDGRKGGREGGREGGEGGRGGRERREVMERREGEEGREEGRKGGRERRFCVFEKERRSPPSCFL